MRKTSAAVLDAPKDLATFGAMVIEPWPIRRPKPYPKNARIWSQSAIEKVANSIREFGWRQPIVCDRDGVIVIGHLRLAAAQFLKLTHVPVHVAADLTPVQIKALRIADNRTHEEAEWNMELLGPEFLELKIDQFDLSLTAFDIGEIVNGVFGAQPKTKPEKGFGKADGLEFRVVVDCAGEQHQAELLARFKDEGLKCRALIS